MTKKEATIKIAELIATIQQNMEEVKQLCGEHGISTVLDISRLGFDESPDDYEYPDDLVMSIECTEYGAWYNSSLSC